MTKVKFDAEELKKLDKTTYVMMMSMTNSILILLEKGMKKGEYMSFCESLWDDVTSNPSGFSHFIQHRMEKDIDDLVNEHQENKE